MLENFAYIALGSNKGDKFGFLSEAVKMINDNEQCKVKEASSVYETIPYGNKDQENFLNAAIKIYTSLNLFQLLNFLKSIEKDLGRVSSPKWGPREIDLDLLFFNNVVYSDERLTVPHKEITKRDFVLVPLCEIAAGFIHPELNKKICDICVDESEKNIIGIINKKLL